MPAELFDATWDKSGRAWDEAQTVTLRLAVRDKAKLPSFSTASGNIVLEWAEGQQPYIPFSVVETSQRTFTITPAAVSILSHFQEQNRARIYIENTGVPRIDRLRFVSTPLVDAENKRELQIPAHDETQLTLGRYEGRTFEVPLPDVHHAGTYQGTLKISANGSQPQSVGITLRTRGPYAYWAVPLALFAATLFIGYWVSRRLAEWIDLGGKQRNESLLAIQDSREELERILERLEKLRGLPRTIRSIRSTLDDIRVAQLNQARRTQAELDAVQQIAAAATKALRQLVRAIEFLETHRPDMLNAALPQLDALDPTAADFAKKVEEVLDRLPTPEVPEGRPEVHLEKFAREEARSAKDELQRKHDRMETLVAAATFFSVFAIAYMTLFVNDPDYGTFTDYLQTVLYGLGLSTAGTAILTKARSGYVRPASG